MVQNGRRIRLHQLIIASFGGIPNAVICPIYSILFSADHFIIFIITRNTNGMLALSSQRVCIVSKSVRNAVAGSAASRTAATLLESQPIFMWVCTAL